MSVHAKKYRVAIGGQSYALISDESEGTIQQAAEIVDSLIKQFPLEQTNVSNDQRALLVAMRMALDFIRLRTMQDQYQMRLTALSREIEGIFPSLL